MRRMETPPLRGPDVEAAMVPPQSLESEQSVLGGLLMDNAAWDRVADVVREDDFYRLSHRLIFKHTAWLIDNNKPADALTVAESLGDKLEEVGGRAYLASLAVNTPSSAHIRRYAEIVADRARKRALITACNEAAERAYVTVTDMPAAELVESLEAKLFVIQERKPSGSQLMSEVLTSVIEHIDNLYCREDKNAVIGLPTGFVDLDHKTAGFQAGDLIVIAGRPSMGKTALAMNVIEHVCIEAREKKTAAIFSLEMSKEQLTQRMIGSVGRVDQHALRAGTFHEADWPKITEATGRISESRIVIEDALNLSPSAMRARCRRLKRENADLALIVVDYLQLMTASGEKRVDQIAEISRGLKHIARELSVPVVALSQLSREVEKRPNKRPQMSDLRESGAIEQDADLILMLYRDEVYHEDSNQKGVAEVIIAKHRSGPTGTVHLTWLDKYTRFENLAGQPPLPMPRGRSRASNFSDYKKEASADE